MSKHHFSLLLGLIGQAGCVVYDDSRLRPPVDAAVESAHDVVTPPRDAPRDGAVGTSDVTSDEVTPSDAGSDSAMSDDVVDVSENDVPADSDQDAPSVPPLNDAGGDMPADRALDRDGGVGEPDVNIADAGVDGITVGCPVGFTVSNVTWNMDGAPIDGGWDGGAPSVRVVGSDASFGEWEPTRGAPMMETAPGTWFVSLDLQDAIEVQFKFVKLYPGYAPEWETWTPFDSNRALRVDCLAEAGIAHADGGPAIGRSYGGAFGVRPIDATK